MVLGHDITEIVPGKFKGGAAFRKGHIIGEEDIEKLLRIGKEHIYILEIDETIYMKMMLLNYWEIYFVEMEHIIQNLLRGRLI